MNSKNKPDEDEIFKAMCKMKEVIEKPSKFSPREFIVYVPEEIGENIGAVANYLVKKWNLK